MCSFIQLRVFTNFLEFSASLLLVLNVLIVGVVHLIQIAKTSLGCILGYISFIPTIKDSEFPEVK